MAIIHVKEWKDSPSAKIIEFDIEESDFLNWLVKNVSLNDAIELSKKDDDSYILKHII
jgi:hypothetical protein